MDLASLAAPEALDSIVGGSSSSSAEVEGGAAPRTVPNNPAALAIRGMICGASDELRQCWHQRLSSPQRLRVATACSGSDVCVLTVEMILHEMKCALNLTGLGVDHVWSCESEPFKRNFLEKVMDVKVIFPDIRSLGCGSAVNAITSKEEPIPEFDLFIVGWSCKDFSSLKRSKKNQPSESLPGLLAEGRGTSGITFHGVLATVSQHRPKAVVMENVAGLLRKTTVGSVVDDTDMSDDNQLYVTCAFNDLGYIVHFKLLNACDAGLPQSRRRVYMIAIRMPSVESATPKHPLLRDIEAAYEGLGQVACPNLADFLLDEVDPAAQSRLMKRQKREDSNLWAISHSKLYNEAGLHWPPEALPHEAQLGRRRAEIIFLVENTMDGSEAEQCFDISQGAVRVGFATGKTCCLTPGAEVWLRNEGRL